MSKIRIKGDTSGYVDLETSATGSNLSVIGNALNVDTINEKPTGNGVSIPGHVIQTVFNTSPPTSYDTMSATSLAATNLDVTITPKSSTSKMLIICNVHVDTSTGSNVTLAIFKDGTILTPKSDSGDYNGHSYFNHLNGERTLLMQAVYATDANVGTTSAVNYKLYAKTHTGNILLRHDLTSPRIIVQEIAT